MNGHAIETRELTKRYGDATAVEDLTWSLPVGSACALLGPNGAGKSTTIRILLGLSQPSAGAVRVLGADPWDHDVRVKARVAYVPERPFLPEWMRARDLFDVHRSLYAGWDTSLERRLVELFQLDTRRRVGALSKGQNRQVHLTLALCQGAELLVLDEPGSGLDVASRRELLSLLSEFLLGEGHTVVLSTHLVTDVERIADRVAVLDRGRLVEDAELAELQEEVRTLRVARPVWERLAPAFEHAGVLSVAVADHEVSAVVRRFRSVADALLRRDLGEGEVIVSESASGNVYVARDGTEARVTSMSLEDVFLVLTEGERDGAGLEAAAR